jgi:hypothetical protein
MHGARNLLWQRPQVDGAHEPFLLLANERALSSTTPSVFNELIVHGRLDAPKPPQKASARSRFHASIQGSVNQLATGGSDGAWSTQNGVRELVHDSVTSTPQWMLVPKHRTRASSTPNARFTGKMQEILGMHMQGCDSQTAVWILGKAVLKSARIIEYASDFPFAVGVHISCVPNQEVTRTGMAYAFTALPETKEHGACRARELGVPKDEPPVHAHKKKATLPFFVLQRRRTLCREHVQLFDI